MIVIGMMILLSMALSMIIVSAKVQTSSKHLSFSKAEEQAQHLASRVTLILEKAMTTTKALGLTLEYAKREQTPRAVLDEILIQTIHQNDYLFGTWTLWEPNAYDGLDSKFANTQGHEKSGRVNSYWHWHNADIINEPMEDWSDASWYNTPKIRGKETLEDPYYYEVSNQQQILVSTIQPIIIADQFHGVVGVDLDLAQLQSSVKNIKVLNSGFAELIANNGMYIAHPDPQMVGTLAPEAIIKSVQAGQFTTKGDKEPSNLVDFFQVQVPILIGNTDNPWALRINVPMDAIKLPGKEIARDMASVFMISGMLMLILLNVFVSKDMAPLTLITEQIREIAATSKGKIGKVSESGHGEVGTLAHAFNLMVDALNESRENLITINNELEDRVVARTEQLEEALEQQKEIQSQLIETEKMASLGTLVAGVAHEINTPVGVALTGATHLKETTQNLYKKQQSGSLKKTDFDHYIESSTQMCDIIESNIGRAATLIANFKMVAVDKSHEEEREVKLADYIDSVLDSLHPNFRKYKVEVETDIDPLLTACCDPGALAHILTNTIMNSFIHGFSDCEREDKKISISCHLQQNTIKLSISDNGKGMKPDILHRVFEPFYTTKRGDGGSGLGMHIIYNLVTHKLGGNVKIESQYEQGAKVKISFPKKQMT